MEDKMYLKPNVVFEPLISNWYAWSHLVFPATAALNLTGRYLPIIDSYLLEPEAHAESVRNPKMLGGPFMDLKGEKVDEVSQLKTNILKFNSLLINFSDAIKALDRLLFYEAKGYGLESLYEKIPQILKGYVELYYDRNNNADFRFVEPLLYKSKYYNKEIQSIAIWVTENDQRPFCLSTPRFKDLKTVFLPLPFEDRRIDELVKMKRIPQPLQNIKSLFDISESDEKLFDSFFTEEKPKEYKKYLGDKIRMRYFGHACILIETKELSILIDPLISYYGYVSEVNHFSYEDIPETIDYVLITHNHQDHILFETLLQLRYKIKTIIVPDSGGGRLEDPNLKLILNNIGFDNVISIKEMETINFSDAAITGIPFTGEHSDLNILSKTCFLVKISKFKLLFMADSRIIDPTLYQHVQKEIGTVDVMFFGMECDGAPLTWLYGPLMTKKIPRDQDASRRLAGSNFEEAFSLLNIFRPKEVYVYAMGQEPWLEYISSVRYTDESNPIIQSNKLIAKCKELGLTTERLFGEKEILYERLS
ncbi:MBL fold metallo-hydrolase [Mucilaginibacter sp. RCC_168]|uniref:MBL fold metallo-hydrolase n=1 Tax=Mucilaginibacter sp. RCC_168 TaxID=3239221 RepID=UPI003526BA65